MFMAVPAILIGAIGASTGKRYAQLLPGEFHFGYLSVPFFGRMNVFTLFTK